ncbi:4'-phosphopantetheinyl transferase family protein [Streptomyces sp. NPDC059447]|uniref:4'-phosphopantetheinyl transferase family protein n=1 Tax=Streptomyces sp. NPDC059447 TaxID=3346834 RepID=UPI0036C3B8C1
MVTTTLLQPDTVREASETAWPGSAEIPGPGHVDLWMLSLPDAPPGPAGLRLLDSEEHRRVATLRHPVARAHYTAAHIMLRRVLGAYLGQPAHAVALRRESCPVCGGPHGRPATADRTSGLHFSLSHGAGLALLGVASAPVGVDVEPGIGDATVAELTPQLHPAERLDLRDELPEGRAALFSRLWTLKEAYLKGLGTGLGRELSLDYVGDRDTAARPDGWSLFNLPVPGAWAACALRCPEGTGGIRGFGRLPPAGL